MLGTKQLAKLRPDDLDRLYRMRVDHGLAPRTVGHIHRLLHVVLRSTPERAYVARNVADAVAPPRVETRELHAPTPAELAQLLDVATGDPLLPLWTLAVYTGARQGELLGLQWQDVDHRTIAIQRSPLQSTRGGVPAHGPPKTKRSRRTVTLPREAIDALRAHRQHQLEQRMALGPDDAAYELVFCTHFGTPYSARNVLRCFKAVLERVSLPKTIRFHDIRHGAATAMLAAGVPLKVASERLGHATTAITADLYTHTVANLEADAAEKLQRAIRAV